MEPESKSHTQETPPLPTPGDPAPPPGSTEPSEFEAGTTVKDLVFFQERKERLASALSILGSIAGSEDRALMLTQLKSEPSTAPRHTAIAKTAEHPASWIVPAALVGGVLCGATGLLFLLDAERPDRTAAWCLVLAGAALGIVAFIFLAKERRDRDAQKTSNGGSETDAAEGMQSEAARLAGAFRETVGPLLTELKMAVRLDDLEGMLAELRAYEEFGRDLEDFHVTT